MEDARPWLRWWRLEGLPEMRALLWERWDPLGLRTVDDWPEDEYDGHANVLASKLKRGNGREDIAEYLTKTLTEEDAAVTPAWADQCRQTAQDLLDWYRGSNAPR